MRINILKRLHKKTYTFDDLLVTWMKYEVLCSILALQAVTSHVATWLSHAHRAIGPSIAVSPWRQGTLQVEGFAREIHLCLDHRIEVAPGSRETWREHAQMPSWRRLEHYKDIQKI